MGKCALEFLSWTTARARSAPYIAFVSGLYLKTTILSEYEHVHLHVPLWTGAHACVWRPRIYLEAADLLPCPHALMMHNYSAAVSLSSYSII